MRLLVVDDSVLVREGLVRILGNLGHEVVESTSRHERLDALVVLHRPDAVVIDIRMPPTFTDEGLRAAARIRATHPDIRILVLSQYVVVDYATQLLETGETGVGYLLKDRILESRTLASALDRLRSGQTVVDPALIQLLVQRRSGRHALDELSSREREVLSLIAQGLSDKGIADALTISLNTVASHIQRVFAKLGLDGSALANRRVLATLRYLHES